VAKFGGTHHPANLRGQVRHGFRARQTALGPDAFETDAAIISANNVKQPSDFVTPDETIHGPSGVAITVSAAGGVCRQT